MKRSSFKSSFTRTKKKPTKKARKKIGRPKKPRTITRRSLVRKLDTIASLYVRKRDNNTCVICGSQEQPTNGHVFSRRAYSTRWDLENMYCSCWGCNFRHIYDMYPYFDWYKRTHGEKQLEELHKRYSTPTRLTDSQLMDMVEEFKRLMGEL